MTPNQPFFEFLLTYAVLTIRTVISTEKCAKNHVLAVGLDPINPTLNRDIHSGNVCDNSMTTAAGQIYTIFRFCRTPERSCQNRNSITSERAASEQEE